MTDTRCCCCDNREALAVMDRQLKVLIDDFNEMMDWRDTANRRFALQSNSFSNRIDGVANKFEQTHSAVGGLLQRMNDVEKQLQSVIAVQPDKPDKKKYETAYTTDGPMSVEELQEMRPVQVKSLSPDDADRVRAERDSLREFVTALSKDKVFQFCDSISLTNTNVYHRTSDYYRDTARDLLRRLDTTVIDKSEAEQP